jgi:Domain of unknown function (DUF4375)
VGPNQVSTPTRARGGHFPHLENLGAARVRDYYSVHRCSHPVIGHPYNCVAARKSSLAGLRVAPTANRVKTGHSWRRFSSGTRRLAERSATRHELTSGTDTDLPDLAPRRSVPAIGRAGAARSGQSACMADYQETLRRWQSTALTVEDIASLPDDDLDGWLWTRLCGVVDADPTSSDLALASAVGALTEPLRAYFATRLFEGEVMNGGLHQYVFNHPEPELLGLVLDGYRVLGLDDQAAVIRDVVPLAAREASWRESLRDGRIETFMGSYPVSALPEFDDRIEEHDTDRLNFVRSRPDAFAI